MGSVPAGETFGGARLRWGGTGWNVGAGKNVGVAGQFSNATLGPANGLPSPFDYNFTIGWNNAGTITSTFTHVPNPSNSATASWGNGTTQTFDTPFTSDFGPQDLYLQFRLNNTQSFTLSNLAVDGTAVGGTLSETASANNAIFAYKLADVGSAGFQSLTGTVSFGIPGGTSGERPAFDVFLANPIPTPAAAGGGLALLGAAVLRRRQAGDVTGA